MPANLRWIAFFRYMAIGTTGGARLENQEFRVHHISRVLALLGESGSDVYYRLALVEA